jgi:hypothetical protein
MPCWSILFSRDFDHVLNPSFSLQLLFFMVTSICALSYMGRYLYRSRSILRPEASGRYCLVLCHLLQSNKIIIPTIFTVSYSHCWFPSSHNSGFRMSAFVRCETCALASALAEDDPAAHRRSPSDCTQPSSSVPHLGCQYPWWSSSYILSYDRSVWSIFW